MAYAALTDMAARYGNDELTQLAPDSTGANPDPVAIGVALTDAAGVIDGYLASRYQLPLNPVPAIVIRWNCDIARFFLWKSNPSDAVTGLYKGAVSGLAAAAQGSLVLEVAAVDTPLNTDTIVVEGPRREFAARDCGFGRGGFGGF